MKKVGLFLLCAAMLVFGTLRINAQGSLTPPGAPAPTMKTLAQIEPRTPIDSTHTPGDATNLYNITQPGSYYLTTNLVGVAGKNGINILANGVTIDLNGFTLIGPGGTNVCGITGPNYGWDLLIRNGTLQNWGYAGIFLAYGSAKFENLKVYGPCIYGMWDAYDDLAQFTHCSASGFSSIGIGCGNSGVLTECTASGLNGSVGFAVGEDCVLNHCTAEECGVGYVLGPGSTANGCTAGQDGTGYQVQEYSTLRDCNALFSTTNGFDGTYGSGIIFIGCNAGQGGTGILTGDDATVANCNTADNATNGIVAGIGCTITGCTANGNGYFNSAAGIVTGIRATISNCTANKNQGDGIRFGGDSTVTGCHASNNGQGGTAAGFHSAGSGSRIDGNQARDNVGTGILATSSDVVIRNTCGNNTVANFNPSTGSNFAPVQTPASATNPLANIVF